MDSRSLRRMCRGKSLAGEWKYGYYVGILGHYIHTDADIYRIDPSTLEQCTGLVDKNGNLIYEGDVIHLGLHDNIEVMERVEMGVGYDTGGFHGRDHWLGWIAGDYSLLDVCRRHAVVGNVHDNPNLMEVK